MSFQAVLNIGETSGHIPFQKLGEIQKFEFECSSDLSCSMWKINNLDNIIRKKGYMASCGYDLVQNIPISFPQLNSDLHHDVQHLIGNGYQIRQLFPEGSWNPIRHKIGLAFAPNNLSKQKLENFEKCSVFGNAYIDIQNKMSHQIRRCCNPFCPTCGIYERRRNAKTRSSELWRIMQSKGYMRAAKKAKGSNALLHLICTLPDIVSFRMKEQLYALMEGGYDPDNVGKQQPYLDTERSINYINNKCKALRKAFDRFALALLIVDAGKFNNHNLKSWWTLWQSIDVHTMAESSPMEMMPHVHGLLTGLYGSAKESKGGVGPGVKMVRNWPNITDGQRKLAQRLWAKIVLEELDKAGVYSARGDEPEEFIVRFEAIHNPNKTDVENLSKYTHRSHWRDLLNSIMFIATPDNDRANRNPILYLEIHKYIRGSKLLRPDMRWFHFVAHQKIELSGKDLLFLKLMVGAIKGITRSQTYGDIRNETSLASIGVRKRQKPTDTTKGSEPIEKYDSMYKPFIEERKIKGKGSCFGLRWQYRIKNPQSA